MIAKRRSLATLVSYQAPPLKKSGLYGEYQELKETIAEYRESRQSAPERCGDLLEQIGRLAENCHLSFHKLEKGSDFGETQLQGNLKLTESDLDEIEACLYEYENSLITDGLHTINEEEVQGLFHALDGGYLSAGTIFCRQDGIWYSLIRAWCQPELLMSAGQGRHSFLWNATGSRPGSIRRQQR